MNNTKKEITLSIVIPCYNEENNIPLILKRFNEIIKRNDIEVILVNNGSTDNSATVINELSPNYSFVRIVNIDVNKGYGYGILQGLKATLGKYVGWTHADMQTDPNDVIRALEIIEKSDSKYIFVKGNRKNRPLFDVFFTICMGGFETLLLRKSLWDINAQPNIFSRELADNWENPPYDFSLDLFALYEAKNKKYKIVRFPVFFPKRIYGKSHWNTGLKAKWKFIKRTVEFSLKLKRRIK